MAPQSRAASGWPFLVAAGHRRDYSILLAPEFLVAGLEYGFLETAARPCPVTAPATVTDLETPGARRVTLVYRTHRLTAADLVVDAADPAAHGADPRDEHGRPLLLIYGFVSPDGWIPAPAAIDLDAALRPALDTYRAFRADEQRAAVTPSSPFPLRSPVTSWPPRAAVPASEPQPARHRARWPILAGLVAAAVAAVLIWSRAAPPPERPSCPTASAVVSGSPTAAASCSGRPGDVSGSPEQAP